MICKYTDFIATIKQKIVKITSKKGQRNTRGKRKKDNQ
jgi:hypothetical protein